MPDADEQVTTWAPRWAVVAATAAGGIVLAVLGATAASGDGAGAVLAFVAAALVVSVAGYDALVRPSLTAGPDGIAVRQGWSPRRYPWPMVTRIEIVTTRRLLVLRALEIDAGDDLVLLSARRLGAELPTVARTLDEYRAARVE